MQIVNISLFKIHLISGTLIGQANLEIFHIPIIGLNLFKLK